MTKSQEYIQQEDKYGAHNYNPIPVVIEKGEGVYAWDVDGKKYIDCLSAYSALNQGHCHPKIIKALIDQAKTLTLTSRAFHSSQLGPFEEYITKLFKYDKILPMNTGSEGVETALKLARRWGVESKKIVNEKIKIICCERNFHGRTITMISMSTGERAYANFGPLTPGFIKIPFNNVDALEKVLKEQGENVAGFLVEPIQGEGGVFVPDDGYLLKCYNLCKKYNVLFIADEIQTGLGRTGRLIACDHDGFKPDILILGKALSGGVFPVSAVLCDDYIMLLIKPGQHGSTFGGNPLACKVARAALEVIIDEKLADNAEKLGKIFIKELEDMKSSIVLKIRGKGLLVGVEIDTVKGIQARDICIKMRDLGVLAKPTHFNTIRFAPPLIITEEQLREALKRIKEAIRLFE